MPIYCRYGNYTHGVGEVEYSINRSIAKYSSNGTPLTETQIVTLSGKLLGDGTVADLNRRAAALVDAYNQHNRELALVSDGGSTIFVLSPGNSVSGVTVTKPPSFPPMVGGAFSTFLDYTIEITSEAAITGAGLAFVSFSETLTYSGGGPRDELIETLYGAPQRQRVRQQTVYQAVQQGQAVLAYGPAQDSSIPSPIWPQYLMQNPQITIGSGKFRNNVQVDIPLSWQYIFKSDRPLSGRPNVR